MAAPDRTFASLDVIAREVAVEREHQARHFESLDAKAGIVLGFSGVLVALSSSPTFLGILARLFAALAAGWAGWAVLPRRLPVLDVRLLRDRYLQSEEQFTKLHLLDTRVVMVRRGADLLRNKARPLVIAFVHLAIAVTLLGARILGR